MYDLRLHLLCCCILFYMLAKTFSVACKVSLKFQQINTIKKKSKETDAFLKTQFLFL